METIIDILKNSVERNWEMVLTNKHLLAILEMANRKEIEENELWYYY